MTKCACGFQGGYGNVWAHTMNAQNSGKHFMVKEYHCICTTAKNKDCLLHGDRLMEDR